MINTPVGTGARTDGYEIRSAAAARRIPCITTMSGGMAAARAIAAAAGHGEPDVISLQEIYAQASAGRVSADARAGAASVAARSTVTAREEHGPYVVLRVADPTGPAPAAGQFYMLAACAGWGGGVGGAPVPAARAQRHARPRGRLRSCSSCWRTSGRAPTRLCELGGRRGLWLLGPLGNGFRGAA